MINFAASKPSVAIDEEGCLILLMGGIEVLCIDPYDGQVFPLEVEDQDVEILKGLGLEFEYDSFLKFDGRADEPYSKV